MVSAFVNVSFFDSNNSALDDFFYDQAGLTLGANTYGSNSYMDHSPTNPDMFIEVCHSDLSVNQKIDLVYRTIDNEILYSTLNYLPAVTTLFNYSSGNESYNCSTVDPDMASVRTLYPGYVYPIVVPEGVNYSRDDYNSSEVYVLENHTHFLNGSYLMQVNVQAPPKVYHLSTKYAYDQNGVQIDHTEASLLTSLVNSTNGTLRQAMLSPYQTLAYNQSFHGGEMVYVNGIKSLEIRVYNPCDPINESGYYVMNYSSWNGNDTCIVINNSDNLIVNFGGELIDGSGNDTTGSTRNETCPVIVQDSQNITFEDYFVQEYYYGVCIRKSKVNFVGSNSAFNTHGALIEQDSDVTFLGVHFSNNQSEIIARNNSHVALINTSFQSAHLKSEFYDATVKSVPNPPPPPSIPNITNISQYIQYTNNSYNSYATVRFYYPDPLPNGAVVDNLSLFRYNGTYGNYTATINVTVNGTNGTNSSNSSNTTTAEVQVEATGWNNGVWEQVYTIISPSEQLIISPNFTNFSVIAPYAFENIQEEPEPEPEPEPDPDPRDSPQSGAGGGGGGTPEAVVDSEDELEAAPKEILLNLSLPDNITLMQGEAGIVDFNISNIGDVPAINLTIGPTVLQGWEATSYDIPLLMSGYNDSGDFQIAPYEKARPGAYPVHVTVWIASEEGVSTVLTEIMTVYVIPRGDLKRLRVLEYPPEIVAPPFSELDTSFLVKNIGDMNLEGVYIKLDSSECLLDVTGANDIKIGETKTFTYNFRFGDEGECKYNIKFYEGEDLVGFLPINFKIRFRTWRDETGKVSFMVSIIIFWTLLTIWVVSRRRKLLMRGRGKI